MSFFPFNLAAAVATGAAMETGRGIARRNGLGFAQGESGGGYDDWGGYFFDDFGNYWEYDWFDVNYGGGGDYWPSFDSYTLPNLTAPTSPLVNDYRYDIDWSQYWNDFFAGNIDRVDTFAQGNYDQPSYRDITGDLDYRPGIWDWLNNLGPGPAQPDRQYGPAGDGALLPRYCPQGTYHPVNDPFACVPFPPNDPNAKKQASNQRKAQQAAANAARKAQQQQDKQCPKDPQGRPVWRNPQTGKCELAPVCPQGQKFDSTARRCLTAAQAKELYGDNNWLMWLLIAAGVLVVVKSGGNSGGGRRR